MVYTRGFPSKRFAPRLLQTPLIARLQEQTFPGASGSFDSCLRYGVMAKASPHMDDWDQKQLSRTGNQPLKARRRWYLPVKQTMPPSRPFNLRIKRSEREVSSSQVHNCPHCGSANLRRSRKRNVIENLLSRLFSLQPYRCDSCDVRFWDRRTHCSSPQVDKSSSG